MCVVANPDAEYRAAVESYRGVGRKVVVDCWRSLDPGRIPAGVDSVLDANATKEFFRENSLNRVDLSADGMGQLMERDSSHWGMLIKSLGIKLD